MFEANEGSVELSGMPQVYDSETLRAIRFQERMLTFEFFQASFVASVAGRFALGSENVRHVPSPTLLSTEIVPP